MEHEITRGLEQAGLLPLGGRRHQGCNVNIKSQRNYRREHMKAFRLRLDEVVIELRSRGFRAKVTPGNNIVTDGPEALAEISRRLKLTLGSSRRATL